MPLPPPEHFNLADWLLAARLREGRGERPALRVGERSWSYREVHELALHTGAALRELGVEQEQRVLLALPDGVELVATLFGTLALGAVAVMVNPELGAEAISTLYAYSRAKAAVVGSEYLPTFAAARGAEWPRALVTVGEPAAGHPSLADLRDEVAPLPACAATHRDDPAIWLFSGGTTGRPKAVVQTHRSFANTTVLYGQDFLGYRETDVTLAVPKLFFGYATGANLFFPFSVGATAVLFPEHASAEEVFAQIRRHRPSILVNVPTMVRNLVAHPDAASQDLSCLRFATSAGEALPPALWQRWRDTFGVDLLDGLGTAEMWHVFLSNRPGEVQPGTLGRAVPGFELRVRDEEGRDLPDGELGRLWVRGDSLALGYWQEADKSREAFRGEWYASGDLVTREADGYFTYHGRADDVLKVGGKWLAPAEVEDCLLRHPAVAECAVVGIPDADGLVKPHAFVVVRETTFDADELTTALRDHVARTLAPYKTPRRIELVPELPRTHLGKIDRGRLRRG
jgi:benzoate-CoA ligase family protein